MSFNLFPDHRTSKRLRSLNLHSLYLQNALSFTIISNNLSSPIPLALNDIAIIFQTQLPKMPKEYIFRQVFDYKHKNFVLIKNEKIIGGICYRPFYMKSFVEIVFCAIEGDEQIQGFGGIMMDYFKEVIKTEAFYNNKLKSDNFEELEKDKDELEDDNNDVEIEKVQKDNFEKNKNESNEEVERKIVEEIINNNEENEDEYQKDNFEKNKNDTEKTMIYKNEIDEEEDKNKLNEVYFEDLMKSQKNYKNNIAKNTIYNNSEVNNTFKNFDLKENINFISNKKNHNFLNNTKNYASNEDYKTFIKPSISYLKKSYKHLKHPIYLMTYADNYAIGYFKKNGFTSEITFRNWVGYIKDYDGGTMMQSKIYWEINYIKKDEFIEKMKEDLIKKMSKKSEFNIIRKGIDVSLLKSVYDIPGLKEAKLSDEMLALKSDGEKLVDILKFLLNDLQSHSSAWPFLFPVKKSEVPDYYNFINKPMDLSTMEMKILKNEYLNVKMFSDDFFLIIKNCYKYNAATTQYYKCAQKLEDFFIKKLDSLNYNDK